ncbi:MAG: RCC1 domain-containing protein [Sandaracinaceae bacterium]
MRALAVLSALMLLSCGEPGELALLVQLRTDLVPGADFFGAELSLPDDGMEGLEVAVTPGEDFSRGVRLAELLVVPSVRRRVQLVLFDVAGEPSIASTVVVRQSEDQVVTVVITRDCRSVSCPGPGDDAGATRCLAGRCTVPECVTGAEESCPEPECAADVDCPVTSACSTGLCSDGVCLVAPAEGRCASGEFCDPDSGCTAIPNVVEDEECGTFVTADAPPCEGEGCQLQATQLDSSTTHACALTAEGLYCWGRNAHGELGTGDRFARLRPARVADFGTVSQVAVGAGFTCATTDEGGLYCWGLNDEGQLGLGDAEDRPVPTEVAGPVAWSRVDANAATACGITQEGLLLCWGRHDEGQVGTGGGGPAPPPVLTPTMVSDSAVLWSDVSVGDGHTCGIQEDGSVHCWGRNSHGQHGRLDVEPLQTRTPGPVGTETEWASLGTAPRGVCGIRTDGTMACWGDASDARLAPVTSAREDGLVAPTDWGEQVQAVDMDAFHGCALLTDASSVCWGRAAEGQIGTGPEPALIPVSVLEGQDVRALSVSRFMTHMATAEDGVYVTGRGCASLGTGDVGQRFEWTPVTR